MPERLTRTDLLLAENLRTLIAARNVDAREVALACGHDSSWISKILNGERGMRVPDVGRAAAFFGLTASELLAPWISPLTERRRTQRRQTRERRTLSDRRKSVGTNNSVAESFGPVVELSRPARREGTLQHGDGDPHPATIEVSPTDIDNEITRTVQRLQWLQALRERTAPPVAGNGTAGTPDHGATHRRDAAGAIHRRHKGKRR